MKLTKKKKIAVSVLAAALAVILAAVPIFARKAPGGAAQAEYRTQAAEYSAIEKTVSATGNVEFVRAGEVKAFSGLLVDEVLVESGDSVKEGDLLARLDKTDVINKLVDAIAYREALNEQLEDSETTSLEKEALAARLEEMDEVIEQLQALYSSPVIRATAAGIVGEVEMAAGSSTGTSVSSSAAASASADSDLSSVLSAYLGCISPVLLAVGSAGYLSDESAEDTTEPTTADTTEPTTADTTETTTEKQSTTGKNTTAPQSTTRKASASGSDYAAAIASAAQNAASATGSASSAGSSAAGTDYAAAIASALEGSDSAASSDYAAAIAETISSSGDASSLLSSSQRFDSEQVTVVSLYSDSSVKIAVSIDELDILDIEKGQCAAVSLDAISDEEFTGEITAVSPDATTGSGNTKYTVDITLDKSEDMRIGMSATVVITTDKRDHALVIPVAALQEKDSQVFVYTGTDASGALTGEVTVETGISDGTNAEILAGLSEGDTVYYEQTDSGSDFPLPALAQRVADNSSEAGSE